MISNIVQDFRHHLGKKNANVKLLYNDNEHNKDNDAHDIFVNADRERVVRVISNLSSNAIKFTKEGFISVSVTVKKE